MWPLALATVEASDQLLAEQCREAIEAFTLRREALLRLHSGEEVEVPAVPDVPIDALQTAGEAATTLATRINDDDFEEERQKASGAAWRAGRTTGCWRGFAST